MLGSQVYAPTQYAANARHVLYPVSSILRITLLYAYNIRGVLGGRVWSTNQNFIKEVC